MNIEMFPPYDSKYDEYIKIGDLIKWNNLIHYPYNSIVNNNNYNANEWVIRVSTILDTPSFKITMKVE